MNNSDLKVFLEELDSDIDEELSVFFNNSGLKSKFSRLVELVVWDDNSLDADVVSSWMF